MEHVKHKCDQKGCYVCENGFWGCEVCGGVEGTLTTDCPGKPLTLQDEDEIMNNVIDFKDGRWVAADRKT